MSVKSARRVEGQRLVYYRTQANAAFWDAHWQQSFAPKIYARAERGDLGVFEKPLTRYLPKLGRILEAGCGLGQYVLALRVRGYDVEGVDWASETVETVRGIYPDIPIRQGDATQLKAPDGYYSGYISLGVVEHRREGPEPFLQEAYRVLNDDGIMLLSVPYFHSLRRAKARLGLYRGRADDLEFYQYAFTSEEMSNILQQMGFTIVTTYCGNSFKGIKDEIPVLREVAQWRPVSWLGYKLLQHWKWTEQNLGHMIMFICRKSILSDRPSGKLAT